jgi:thioredoxin 2
MNTYSVCESCGKVNRIPLEEAASKAPICGSCKANLPFHFGVTEVSGTGLKSLIAKSPLPVICDFWASWCGPCKAFAPTFQQAALRFGSRAVFVKLNTEKHSSTSDAYKVKSIPTLILFSNGIEKDRIAGALPLDAFGAWLEEKI